MGLTLDLPFDIGKLLQLPCKSRRLNGEVAGQLIDWHDKYTI